MKTERESKEFWTYNNIGGIVKVIGYDCDTGNYWWIPSMGFSGCVGASLFIDKKEALRNAIIKEESAIIKSQNNVKKLKNEISKQNHNSYS